MCHIENLTLCYESNSFSLCTLVWYVVEWLLICIRERHIFYTFPFHFPHVLFLKHSSPVFIQYTPSIQSIPFSPSSLLKTFHFNSSAFMATWESPNVNIRIRLTPPPPPLPYFLRLDTFFNMNQLNYFVSWKTLYTIFALPKIITSMYSPWLENKMMNIIRSSY